MNQSIKHDAHCDRTTAHNVRSPWLVVMLHYRIILREVTKKHADKEKTQENHYLLQCHDTHQLSNTGDIGVTESQQREQSVGLSNDREREEHNPVSVKCIVL